MVSKSDAYAMVRNSFPNSTETSSHHFSIAFSTEGERRHPVFVSVQDFEVLVESPFAQVTSVSAEQAFAATEDYFFWNRSGSRFLFGETRFAV